MKAYRYNSEKREDRHFNNCGSEKNPNSVKFYATNLAYADKYKVIHTECGEVDYECALEVTEIENVNLFDMTNNFKSLSSYSNYINKQISAQMKDYTKFMNNAQKASDRKMWAKQIDDLKNREQELISNLILNEFQTLSDYETQNELVSELKSLGFEGYVTKNEVAIF